MRLRYLSLLIILGVVLPMAASAQAWIPLTSGVTNDLNNLACVDARTCYAVGGAPFIGGPGIILKTTNGGESWSAQSIPTTNPLRGISCPSSLVCYVAGDGGALLKTTNGGVTWVAQSAPNLSTFPGQAQPWFWDVWATSEMTAIAVGNVGAIYRTTNGGDTWVQIVAGAEDNNLHGVFFPNSSTGWILGGGVVLKTTNGGTGWVRQTPGDLSPFGWDAFSFDGTTVWVSGGTVHKSVDGGAMWVRQVAPLVTYRGIEFTDVNNGWIVGGLTQRTTDGGATWSIVSMPTSQILRDIQCIGSSLCYTVGDDGTIIRYGTPPSPPQPELVVGDRSLTCPAGELGLEFAEYRYRIVVTNSGTASSGPFTVRIEGVNATGASLGTPINRMVTDLAAGAATTIEGQANVGLLNPTAAATVTIRVTADVLSQVTESNETNNTGTIVQTCATTTATPTNRPPNPPAALAQRANIGERDQLPGWVVSGRLVAFKAELSDPDATDVVGMDIEVKPISTAFTGTPTFAAIMHPNPITAQRGELLDPGSYHWRARAKDNHDVTSDWVPFAGNPETEADFIIPAPVSAPAVSPAPSTPSPSPSTDPVPMVATPPPTTTATPTVTLPPASTTVPSSTPGVEHPVAAAPTAVEQPATTPSISPEEKRAIEEATRRLQLETITREAPKVLLGVERFVQEKGIVRSDALEALASQKIQAIAESKLPELPTPKATEVRGALTTFIAYGTEPTAKLGAGERAGVVDSYKGAFGKLPETQQDWEDVMKIAVGRFPSQTSAARETAAETTFQKIYLRNSDVVNPNDRAAISILSYGLRPANRRLASESVAIRSFKRIYKRAPSSAGDWDTVRCIAYSGAKR